MTKDINKMSASKDKQHIELELQDNGNGGDGHDVERMEEAKFLSKYPMGLANEHSLFLQKRLHKGYKFFDSGDYQMAKQIGSKQMVDLITGGIIPTPETVPVRKLTVAKQQFPRNE